MKRTSYFFKRLEGFSDRDSPPPPPLTCLLFVRFRMYRIQSAMPREIHDAPDSICDARYAHIYRMLRVQSRVLKMLRVQSRRLQRLSVMYRRLWTCTDICRLCLHCTDIWPTFQCPVPLYLLPVSSEPSRMGLQ